MKNFYAILEVHPNATQDEIKHAWRELLQVWHPDRFVHNPVLQKKVTEKTKDINEAYEVLGNPLNRQSYDSKRRSHKDFRSKTEKPTQEEKTITECPNPSCRTKLRVAKISEPIKIFCPNCHWSFNFDAERGAKNDIRAGQNLPEIEIQNLLSRKGASLQLIGAFIDLAQQILRARSNKVEIRTTKDFVPFSLKTVERHRNFADVISVSGNLIDLALKTGEPDYPFVDSNKMTRLIRSQAKNWRFGSYQREVSLQKREDVPCICELVLQCCDNLSNRMDF